LEAEARRPFNLSRDLLLRAGLMQVAQKTHCLLLVIHHISSDEWSFRILLRELGEFYSAEVLGRLPRVPALELQYADYARAQRERFEDQDPGVQLRYWRKQLEGSTGLLELPTDHPRPPRQRNRGATEYFRLDENLTPRIRRAAIEQRTTPF